MLVLVFMIVALSLVLGLHWYLYRRLVVDTTRPGSSTRRWATAGLVTVSVLMIGALAGSRGLPLAAARFAAWPGYLWMGMLLYLLLVLWVLELPRLLLRIWWRRRVVSGSADTAVVADPQLAMATSVTGSGVSALAEDPDPDLDPVMVPAVPVPERAEPDVNLSRRLLLGRSAAASAGLVAFGALAVGVPTALGSPRIRRVEVPLSRLPSSADGTTIALFSDVHLGPLLGREHTQRIVDLVNGLNPDVVAIAGDLVDGSVADLGGACEPLAQLRGRLGTFFVTGNHDYYSGHQQWETKVRSLGIRVLRNERVELDGFDIAGVNDANAGGYGDAPDYDRAIAGRAQDRPVVLLAHQPVQAVEAARRGFDLQLSGHTHGGQMWPLSLLVGAQQKVAAGLGQIGGMPVFVSRGVGFWGPPFRVATQPDIGLIRLRSGQ